MGRAKRKGENLKLDVRYVCSQNAYSWVSLTHVSMCLSSIGVVFLLFLLLATILQGPSFTPLSRELLSLWPLPGIFVTISSKTLERGKLFS